MTHETDTPRTDASKPKLTRESYDENWHMKQADTPRTDECRCCGDPFCEAYLYREDKLKAEYNECVDVRDSWCEAYSSEREARQKAEDRLKVAEDLIKGLHDGWKKARKAHLATCKNAQAEINKLHTENVCLQELIQEFYEWSRRDYPTEQEVREIMNRYHNLLNK